MADREREIQQLQQQLADAMQKNGGASVHISCTSHRSRSFLTGPDLFAIILER